MSEVFLEAGEAARRLGVSREYVRQLAARGALRIAFTTDQGTRVFSALEVERLRRDREAAGSKRGHTVS